MNWTRHSPAFFGCTSNNLYSNKKKRKKCCACCLVSCWLDPVVWYYRSISINQYRVVVLGFFKEVEHPYLEEKETTQWWRRQTCYSLVQIATALVDPAASYPDGRYLDTRLHFYLFCAINNHGEQNLTPSCWHYKTVLFLSQNMMVGEY